MTMCTNPNCGSEENVYLLCKRLSQVGLASADLSDLFVVFVSNAIRQIPIWRQKSSKNAGGLCIWDYHVICIQRGLGNNPAQVWDLDTTLPCPASLEEYVAEALQPQVAQRSEFARLYRVVAAPIFLRFFASDRRHMRDGDGYWMASPPIYDCLVAEDGTIHNLEEFINLSSEQVLLNLGEAESLLMNQRSGVVLTEEDFQRFFN